jgi:hypothetical protein
MGNPVVYGPRFSTYVRSVLLALEEKGVPYDVQEVNILEGAHQSPAHVARHPFSGRPKADPSATTGSRTPLASQKRPASLLFAQLPRQSDWSLRIRSTRDFVSASARHGGPRKGEVARSRRVVRGHNDAWQAVAQAKELAQIELRWRPRGDTAKGLGRK